MGLFYVHYSPLLLWDLFMYRVHFIMEPFMYNYSLCIKDSPHAPPTLHKKDPILSRQSAYTFCLIIGWCCRHLLILIERWFPCLFLHHIFPVDFCRYTDPCFINTLYYKYSTFLHSILGWCRLCVIALLSCPERSQRLLLLLYYYYYYYIRFYSIEYIEIVHG